MRPIPRPLMLLAYLSMPAVEARAVPDVSTVTPSAASAPTIPETPAGKRFSAWLAAFNAIDRDALAAFVAAFAAMPAPTLDAVLGMRQRSGGFTVRKIEESSETRIVVLLEQHEGEQFARAVLEVDATPDHRIVSAPIRAIPTPPEFAAPRIADADLPKQLDAQLKSLEAADTFSGAVLIMKGEQTVFERAYGYADRGQKLRNVLDSKFRIGSMGKMFTATAVVQLIQAGKISLSDPIGKYLPDYPNKEVAAKVTIEHLLTHTGGTGDIFTDEFAGHAAEIKKLEDYVNLLGKTGLRFEPGARYEYSNYGYVLLGRVIEVASDEDYYSYLQRHIFDPAGMTSTGFWPESKPLPGRVIGYDPQPGGFAATRGVLTDRASPAGGAISTVGDMLRFSRALLGHKLLGAQYTELLMTGRVQMGPNMKYAFGFGDVGRGSPQHHIGHNGGAPGQNGDLQIYPEAGYIVVVLSNFSPPAAQRVSDYIGNRLKI
jgi:D-alanyl-D-alanine carboxypeptidase